MCVCSPMSFVYFNAYASFAVSKDILNMFVRKYSFPVVLFAYVTRTVAKLGRDQFSQLHIVTRLKVIVQLLTLSVEAHTGLSPMRHGSSLSVTT